MGTLRDKSSLLGSDVSSILAVPTSGLWEGIQATAWPRSNSHNPLQSESWKSIRKRQLGVTSPSTTLTAVQLVDRIGVGSLHIKEVYAGSQSHTGSYNLVPRTPQGADRNPEQIGGRSLFGWHPRWPLTCVLLAHTHVR